MALIGALAQRRSAKSRDETTSQSSISISAKLGNIGIKRSPKKLKKEASSPPAVELVSDADHSARSRRLDTDEDFDNNQFNQAKLRS